MKKTFKIISLALVFVILFTACAGTGKNSPSDKSKDAKTEKNCDNKKVTENNKTEKKEEVPKFTLEEWQADLEQLYHDLTWYNPEPFCRYGEAAFKAKYEQLERDLPNLSERQKEWRLRELIYSIGDGHIDIWKKDEIAQTIPVMIDELVDGYYIINATDGYKDLIGLKVETINDIKIEDLISNFEKISNAESKYWQRANAINKLHFIMYYDLIDSLYKGKTNLVKINNREIKTLYRNSLNLDMFVKKVGIGRLPRFDMKFLYTDGLPYTHEWINDDKGLVIRFSNHRKELENYGLMDFGRKVAKEVSEKKPEVLLVDFRDNGGGSIAAFAQTFSDSFFKNNGFFKSGNLYVATNRNTFSAAGISAELLKRRYGGVVIGTATGGSPFTTNVSQTATKTLKKTGMFFRVSSAQITSKLIETPSLLPDVEIKFTIEDIENGIDPVLKYVVEQVKKE